MTYESKSLDELERISLVARNGDFSYVAGAAGSRTVAGRIQSIYVHATTAGSLTINGGDSIPVPANVGFVIAPEGRLVNATIVFTGTDLYIIELAT